MPSIQDTAQRPAEGLRVAVLWQRLSGYAHASFRALRDLGVEVRVVHRANDGAAPFDEAAVTVGLDARSWTRSPDQAMVDDAVADLDPHAVLMTSWHPTSYRRTVRGRRGRSVRILCMDNQWWGTPKQWLGVATSPMLIRPCFDAALVGSERGADFARRFGFPQERIIRGIYTCDHERFAAVAAARQSPAPDQAFLFVGRLVAEKGVDVLAEAYRRYRSLVTDPWPLIVGGTGPELGALQGLPGIEALGFVQPDELPALMARTGCLVLPSRFEPWGVVVHEATSAGLSVVCTNVCGAASRLVLDGYNGGVVDPDDPDQLARAMARQSEASESERALASAASRSLAAQYTPQRWAAHLVRRILELQGLLGIDAVLDGDRTGRPPIVSTAVGGA